jgi:hypothetical protein
MISLKTLILENAENRVNMMRVQTIMEKVYPMLTETQTKALMQLCTEIHMMVAQLNTKPYLRTEASMMEWKLLLAATQMKLNELKSEVLTIAESKEELNLVPLIKALDEVLIN